jgi:hypothetical protein
VPRISSNTYLNRCSFLRKAWLEFPTVIDNQSPNDQWVIHSYFQPSKHLSPQQQFAHRKIVNLQRLSLPARAGKIYAQICIQYERRLAAESQANPAPARKGTRLVRARGVVRPAPDAKLIAQAIVNLAEQMAWEREQEGKAA